MQNPVIQNPTNCDLQYNEQQYRTHNREPGLTIQGIRPWKPFCPKAAGGEFYTWLTQPKHQWMKLLINTQKGLKDKACTWNL